MIDAFDRVNGGAAGRHFCGFARTVVEHGIIGSGRSRRRTRLHVRPIAEIHVRVADPGKRHTAQVGIIVGYPAGDISVNRAVHTVKAGNGYAVIITVDDTVE